MSLSKFFNLGLLKSKAPEITKHVHGVFVEIKGKEKKKKSKADASINYLGKKIDDNEMGEYENFEIPTLNLKSKKLLYTSNLPSSFGVGDYEYHLVVEWSQGFYQMFIKIEEIEGKLKYTYEFFDVNGKTIDFNNLEKSISN